MNTICVYYDLANQDQDNRLINYLKSFNGFAKAGARIWFVNSNKSCAQIRDEINHLNIPTEYRILVFRVGETWSSINLKPETSTWLHEKWTP